jgi:hypothetical protein
MSKVEFYLLVAGFAFFALWWRLDRLGRQVVAASHLIQIEMAELMGNEERRAELHEEWRLEQAERMKENRRMWITWGVAALLAWWWFAASH